MSDPRESIFEHKGWMKKIFYVKFKVFWLNHFRVMEHFRPKNRQVSKNSFQRAISWGLITNYSINMFVLVSLTVSYDIGLLDRSSICLSDCGESWWCPCSRSQLFVHTFPGDLCTGAIWVHRSSISFIPSWNWFAIWYITRLSSTMNIFSCIYMVQIG